MSHHRPFKLTMFHHQQLKPEMLDIQLMLLRIKMLQILLLKQLITLKVDTFPTAKQMGLMFHQAINPNILTELISQANLHTTTQLKKEQLLIIQGNQIVIAIPTLNTYLQEIIRNILPKM